MRLRISGRERIAGRAQHRSAFRRVAALILAAAVVVGGLIVFDAPAPAEAAVRGMSVRYSDNLEGGTIRVLGNAWSTCSTTVGWAASSCASARNYGVTTGDLTFNSNSPAGGSRNTIDVDVDGVNVGTNLSSSSDLQLPAGAQVAWAGAYWTSYPSAIPRISIDGPGSAGIAYEAFPATTTDSAPLGGNAAMFSHFADVTALVQAQGSGTYTASPSARGMDIYGVAGWSMMVVYSVPGDVNRQVVINDGLVAQQTGGTTAITFGGFRTPPVGNVRADIATVIYDADAGFTDSVSVGNTLASQTKIANPGPIANDYANASIRNLGVQPPSNPAYANNFSVDAKVTSTRNAIGNSQTSAIAVFDTRGSNEFEFPAVIGIAVDNYLASVTADKTVTDENGGAVRPGDFLTYRLAVQSTGSEASTLSILRDRLPTGVVYVPGSLSITQGANPGVKTDAAGDDQAEYDAATREVSVRLGVGATATTGGVLPARPNSPVQAVTFRTQISDTQSGAPIVNTAVLSGTGGETSLPFAESSTAAGVTPVLSPAIAIDKAAMLDDVDRDGAADPGDSITYGFTVTNTGDVVLSAVAVADPALGAVTCAVSTLAPAQSTTCSAPPRSVSQADLDAGAPLTNTATATATASNGARVSAADGTSTPIADAAPQLELRKVAGFSDDDGDGALDVGETIRWSFVVTNTGEATARDLAIADPLAGPVSCPVAELPRGATTQCVADAPYAITDGDVFAGAVRNTATATATNPRSGATVISNASSTQTPTIAQPSIDIAKTATVDPAERQGGAAAGDAITYTFVVTNTGNVPLGAIVVDDPDVGAVTCALTTLRAGESTNCTAALARTVTQADVDTGAGLSNTAEVTGASVVDGQVVNDSDTALVPVVAPAPALAIEKTAVLDDADGDGVMDAGETIAYRFDVTNTGNITVDDVGVADDFIGDVECDIDDLAPRETTACESLSPHLVTQGDVDAGVVTNTATAIGTSPRSGTPVVSAPDTAEVRGVPEPAIALDKVATVTPAENQDAAETGDSIRYTFTVTNAGNTSLTDVAVSDPTLGAVVCASSALLPGDSTLCTSDRVVVVTQADAVAGAPISNTASVTAQAIVGGPVRDSDTAVVEVARIIPPAAVDDAAETRQGVPATIDVLADDEKGTYPLNPDSLAIVAPDGSLGPRLTTAEGTFQVVDGKIRFTPLPTYVGTTPAITYSVADTAPTPIRTTADVVVTVTPAGLPVASPDAEFTPFEKPIIVDVLGDDDPGPDNATFDPGTLRLVGPAGPVTALVLPEGAFEVVGGQVRFTPAAGFRGAVPQVEYTASTDLGTTVSSTIDITVGAPVVAEDDIARTPAGMTVEIPVLRNDTADPSTALDPASVVFPAGGQPSGATVSADGKTLAVPREGVYIVGVDGSVAFTPDPGFSGSTTTPVTYQASDADGLTDTARITVVVGDRPAATSTPDVGRTAAGQPVTVPVLDNDRPSPGAEWVPSSVVFPTAGQPSGATVSAEGKTLAVPGEGVHRVEGDGSITFTPDPAFTGQTTPIAYRATDSAGVTVTSTLTLIVTGDPAPPPTTPPPTTPPVRGLPQTGGVLPIGAAALAVLLLGLGAVGIARRRNTKEDS